MAEYMPYWVVLTFYKESGMRGQLHCAYVRALTPDDGLVEFAGWRRGPK